MQENIYTLFFETQINQCWEFDNLSTTFPVTTDLSCCPMLVLLASWLSGSPLNLSLCPHRDGDRTKTSYLIEQNGFAKSIPSGDGSHAIYINPNPNACQTILTIHKEAQIEGHTEIP